jgi:hypothetical protein
VRRALAVGAALAAVVSLTIATAAERDRPAPPAEGPAGAEHSGPVADERAQPRCSPPFRVDRWPGACWRPYRRSSPFNQRLPARPRLSPDSDRVVHRLTADGGPSDLTLGVADTGSDWDHPTYYASRSDPLYTLRCYETAWGTCEIEGHRIRIPRAARPAGGSDAHMTVIDRAHRWEYDLYKVRSKPRRGGLLELRWGGRTRLRGQGLGSDATAAHFGLLAGVIRAEELHAGRIRHALFVRVDCDDGTFVYPAHGVGAACDDVTDAPPEGARFQLAMSRRQIDALGAPAWKRAILVAMAEYGFFVGDTGGSPWDVVLESGSTYTSFGRRDRWETLARAAGAERSASGRWRLDLAGGVDWARHLRVIDPCVTRRSC